MGICRAYGDGPNICRFEARILRLPRVAAIRAFLDAGTASYVKNVRIARIDDGTTNVLVAHVFGDTHPRITHSG